MAIPTVVQELILEAWENVRPRLLNEPDELARRLARRRSAILTRPWRPFCLAIRASDVRINPYWFIVTPEHAMDLDDPRHPYEYLEHDVTLTSQRVRMLTQPVKIGRPGEPAFEVAERLGCEYGRFRSAMRHGTVSVVRKKGLRGRPGIGTALVYNPNWLDPGGPFFQFPDKLWGTHPDCGPLHKRIPDGIEQTLRRVPTYSSPRGRRRFTGWRWLCPACQHESRMVFRPLPPPMLALDESLPAGIRSHIADCHPRETGLQCFACRRCHGILSPPRKHAALWNALVTLFTGGLLAGTDVDVPPHFNRKAKTPRKRRFIRHRPHPATSEHIPEILRLILETDWSQRRLAAELGIAQPTVGRHIRRLLRDHNVSTRADLRLAHARRSAVASVA